MDWMREWKEKGLLSSPAVKEAAEQLESKQLAFRKLPDILKGAGVNKKDPLTVEVFVEIMSRHAEQEVAEHQLMMVVLYEELLKAQKTS
jgi:hypothetical protein